MAGALGLVLTTDVAVQGSHAVPVYVDDSLPIVGPSRACVISDGSTIPFMGGPPLAVRLAPPGTPAIGPALPVYVVPGGGILDTLAYTNKILAVAPANLIQYLVQGEPAGATTALDSSGNGRTGAYTAVTLGGAGIGDGRTSAAFDGVTSFENIYSASLNGAFTPGEFTIAIWGKVASAGVWTDATARRLYRIRVDGNNSVEAYRTTVNNQLEIDYIAGGTVKGAAFASGAPTSFFHIAVSVSKSGDAAKIYFNGAQQGATLTGLGVWAGALGATVCNLGASTQVPNAVWSGSLAHFAIWNTPLSAAQIASMVAVP